MTQTRRIKDVVTAWVRGKQIQFFNPELEDWEDFGHKQGLSPMTHPDMGWRVKPDVAMDRAREVTKDDMHQQYYIMGWRAACKYYGVE
jgi:hypothetical protein